MRAVAAFPSSKRVSIVDHPEPEAPSPTAACVRTLEVGICGTDGELCAFHFGYAPAGEEYLVLGHEALGVVEEVGAEVRGLRPGDLVVPSVRRPCGRRDCPACRSGHRDFCVTHGYVERGIFGAHGFLVDHFVEDERYLYKVPAALREVAVLTEPLTIAEKGLRQFLAIERRLPWLRDQDDAALLLGKRAVVLGAGPVGLLGAMLLRLRGCEVSVYSREERASPRGALVESLGARYLASTDFSIQAMAEEVGGVELVYEAAGAAALTLAVLEVLAPNGVFILTGATGGGGRTEIGADALLNRMVERNLVLAGTVNSSDADFRSAIHDLEEFDRAYPAALRALITGRRRLEEFCACALHRPGIKDVVDLSGAT